jgi:hypothetical protein
MTIIVQSSDNPIVIKAVTALFNKPPDTSILVKFDQNGNLVTLKGEAYTPTGDTRVNLVFCSPSRLSRFIIPTMNDFLIITAHGFRAIFVHLHIARSTGNANAS